MKRFGLILLYITLGIGLYAQVKLGDTSRKDCYISAADSFSNGSFSMESFSKESLSMDSLLVDSLSTDSLATDSLKNAEETVGTLQDLLLDEDLQPLDDILAETELVQADSLMSDSANQVAMRAAMNAMMDAALHETAYSEALDSLNNADKKAVTLDSLDVHSVSLIGMDMVMPEPSEIDSLLTDSLAADTLGQGIATDSLYTHEVLNDSLLMDQLVLDSTIIDTLKFDSAYYYRQQEIIRDSLRRDSIRTTKIEAEKRRLMVPLCIREFKQMILDYQKDINALLDDWDDYYNPRDYIKMRPEFYKYVVPPTYYQSSIREVGRLDNWEPTDKYTEQQKIRQRKLNEQLPDLCYSKPYYETVERQMLHFYVNYPSYVTHNEADFAHISILSDKDLEAAPRTENVLTMIQPNTVERVSESDLTVLRPNFWTKGGSGYLQFSQNYVSDNWYKGGESTKSLLSGLVLYANYNDKHRIQFENKLEWKLGFITAPSDTLHTYKANNDLFRLSSKFGLKAISTWYYTLSFDFKTQFFPSYQTNTDNLVSAFLSPAELNIGLGMDYKYVKNALVNLSVLINPINYTLYTVTNEKVDPTKFNIKEGHTHESVIGSRFEANLKWKVFQQLMWESRMSYNTNYEKVFADWENTFTFVVNKYISTKLFVNARFDDGVKRKEGSSYFQLQEILSFGLNYTW